jgi:hypothetical protein
MERQLFVFLPLIHIGRLDVWARVYSDRGVPKQLCTQHRDEGRQCRSRWQQLTHFLPPLHRHHPQYFHSLKKVLIEK